MFPCSCVHFSIVVEGCTLTIPKPFYKVARVHKTQRFARLCSLQAQQLSCSSSSRCLMLQASMCEKTCGFACTCYVQKIEACRVVCSIRGGSLATAWQHIKPISCMTDCNGCCHLCKCCEPSMLLTGAKYCPLPCGLPANTSPTYLLPLLPVRHPGLPALPAPAREWHCTCLGMICSCMQGYMLMELSMLLRDQPQLSTVPQRPCHA